MGLYSREYVYPISNFVVNWTPSTGTNWQCVAKDHASPNDTTYNSYSTNSSIRDDFNTSLFSLTGAETVNNIATIIRAKNNGAGNVKTRTVVLASGFTGTAVGSSSWTTYTTTWTVNPSTLLPWAIDDARGTGPAPYQHIGVVSSNMAAGRTVYCSQLYAQCDYNVPPVATITSPASDLWFAQGATVTLAGTGVDQEDGTLTGSSLQWASSLDGNIGSGTSVVTSALSIGTHTITLTATDSNGAIGSYDITLSVNAAPVALISSPIDTFTYDRGTAIQFSGSGTDPEEGQLTGSQLQWSSSLDGHLGIGASFTLSTLSIGTHIITLTVTDTHGSTNSTHVTISINAVPIATITSPDPDQGFIHGTPIYFTGSGLDSESGNITGYGLQWISSIDGHIGYGTSFNRSDLSYGDHLITLSATDSAGSVGHAYRTIHVVAESPFDITSHAVYSALLPQGEAWHPTETGSFMALLAGMSINNDRMVSLLATLRYIRNPLLTPILDDLEKEFGLIYNSSLTEAQRRARILTIKTDNKNLGTADFIQAKLQSYGFDVQVHQNNPPVDPAAFIFKNYYVTMAPEASSSYSVTASEVSGATYPTTMGTNTGELVVNGITDSAYTEDALDVEANWGFFFFIGGNATRDNDGYLTNIETVQVSRQLRPELRALICKYKPLHTWCGVLVDAAGY